MCKQTSYSKYQRNVIKFLTEHLDVDTPFTYERTQTNHLKVLIDGLEKPFYTSSTPSDSKSLANFSADVKRELKASRVASVVTDNPEQEPPFANYMSVPHEKLVKACIKSLRTRLEAIKSKEQEKVQESRSLDVIPDYRKNVVKRAIELVLQNRSSNDYVKSKEKKIFEAKVAKYLDFMMPTLAQYAALLDSKASLKKKISERVTGSPASNNTIKLAELKPRTEQAAAAKAKQTVSEKNAQEHALPNVKQSAALNTLAEAVSSTEAALYQHNNQSSAAELMSMSVNNRVNLLRNLSKAQALQLIEDINQALALNREQDIEAVIALIKEKGVSLEAVIERLDAA